MNYGSVFGHFSRMKSVTNLQLSVSLLLVCCVNANMSVRTQKQMLPYDVNVREFVIVSNIVFRYAHVTVRSYVENKGSSAKEVNFQVRLPKEAFITGFVLVTNNKTISAVVKEKGKALIEYNNAKQGRAGDGCVTRQTLTDDFDRDVFDVNVNVAGGTDVELRLEYEELLQRHAGKYSQKIYVNSEHVIPKLEVKCELKDKQKFKLLKYRTPFYTERVHAAYTSGSTDSDGYYYSKIDWKPSTAEQENAQTRIDTAFEVEYDLDVRKKGGIVVINDKGEFTHLFSGPCDERKIMNKQIVFVIDVSGSMDGNPVEQVKEAMTSILARLRPHDYFNIILFSDGTVMWKGNFQQATPINVNAGKVFVKGMVKADGSTNINDALLLAVDMFDRDVESISTEKYGQIIVFLTDGSPTYGETDTKAIRRNVRARNYIDGERCCKASINTIAFGKFADKNFLQVIAHDHEGILTIIKETESNLADGELIKVYKGIENPYYKNLQFSFTTDGKEIPQTNITQSQFLQYDCGNEIVISGWTRPIAEVTPKVKVNDVENEEEFLSIPIINVAKADSEILSRLVAYNRLKALLRKAETTLYPEKKAEANKMALELSLKYGFVTPLTSLVVTDFSKTSAKIYLRGQGTILRAYLLNSFCCLLCYIILRFLTCAC